MVRKNKTERILLAIEPQFKLEIEETAAKLGLSVSAFIRFVLKLHLTHAKIQEKRSKTA